MTAKLLSTLFDGNDELIPFHRFFDLLNNRQLQAEGLDYSAYENDSHFFVEVPMPGLSLDEIAIKLDKGDLWISGEAKKEKKEEKPAHYYRCKTSRFFYHVPLPEGIDLDNTPKAVYKQGIITVQFEKRGGYRSKVIPISFQEDEEEKQRENPLPP